MNNEEKILSILEQMQGDITGLKQDVSGLKQDVSFLNGRVAAIEYEHGKKLDFLIDGQIAINEEIKDLRFRLLRVEQGV